MALKKLTLMSLAEMDGGRIGEAVAQALERLTVDMQDRPGNKSKRTLTLTMSFDPIPGEAGALDGVNVSARVDEKIPARKSKGYAMRPTAKGGLVFNELTPENADQGALFDEGDLEGSRPEEG